MSHEKAKLIFERALLANTDLTQYDIAFDNVKYTPVTNKTYLQTHLMPVDTSTQTLNGADHTRLIGLFQIKILTEAGKGSGLAASIAEKIKQTFPTDKMFVDGSFWVQVVTPLSVDTGRAQDGFWTLPCYFRYQSDTN